MERKPYPRDVTDQQWTLIEALFPRAARRPRPGRPRQVERREVVNALVYHAREGCSGRAVPHDFPPWDGVSHYFREWNADGTGPKVLGVLRPRARVPAGPALTPSAAAIDSQSVPTARGGKQRGIDGGTKVQGRQRPILVAALGFGLAVVVTAAHGDDARAAPAICAQVRGRDFPRRPVVCADGKYRHHERYEWRSRPKRPYRRAIVRRPPGEKKFQPLPVRWVVERTDAGPGRYRCPSKDDEHTPEACEAMMRLAAVHHLLQRLRPKGRPYSQRFRFRKP